MSDAPRIARLCIIGIGLIGGSLARALRAAGAVDEVVGCARNEADLQRAVELGFIDRYSTDPAEAAAGADVVFLAVPVGAMAGVCARLKGVLGPDTLLTDGGSTKISVINAVREGMGELPANFVPGHPIAGTEKSGVEASFPTLYQQRMVILTPLAHNPPALVARARWLWERAGAMVVEMGAEHHDEVLAATSHLPHLLAFSLVDTLANLEEHPEIFRYAAGGFRDFTRIASSDPTMWRDICLANREALLSVLSRFRRDLDQLASAIAQGDGTHIHEVFTRAKAERDQFCELFGAPADRE